MTGTIFTPLLASLNKRQYPVTQDQLNSLVLSTGVVTFSSLTQALAPYLLISALPASLAPYVTTASLAATLATFPALSTTNVWTGKQEFKDLPWADVMAFGALGNNSHNDTPAIQAAIDHMNGVYGGGFVFLPPGNYVTSSLGLTVKGGVILMGSGQGAVEINGTGQDATVLTFDGTCSFAGIQDVTVGGYQNATAVNSAAVIASGIVVNMRNVKIAGGRFAINNGGVDGRVYNVFAFGMTGCVYSTGANFYTDCKFDNTGSNILYGFYRAPYYTTGVAEDQIVDTDLSGNFTYSLYVDDGTAHQVRTKLIGCVLSSPIYVLNHNWTLLNGCEIGSQTYSLTTINPITIMGCYQQGGTVTLAGANVIKSANFQIA